MNLKNTLFILFIALQINTFAQSHFRDVAKTNKSLPGQTAPYDMIFVEGNRDMPSFYIGIQEEPNINYMIYLKWLIQVFGQDQANVVLDALPVDRYDSNGVAVYLPFKYKLVQKYIKNAYYSFSEKVYPVIGDTFSYFPVMERMADLRYAYEPVTNLSWKQIQNYMAWKTDRLNEMILIKKRCFEV